MQLRNYCWHPPNVYNSAISKPEGNYAEGLSYPNSARTLLSVRPTPPELPATENSSDSSVPIISVILACYPTAVIYLCSSACLNISAATVTINKTWTFSVRTWRSKGPNGFKRKKLFKNITARFLQGLHSAKHTVARNACLRKYLRKSLLYSISCDLCQTTELGSSRYLCFFE